MKLPEPMVKGRLLRRYKRFLADVELEDGTQVTAHTANTGTMLQCALPGAEVLLSQSDNPKRKLRYSWELVRVNGYWVDINTHRANRVVEEALREDVIPQLAGFEVTSEFSYANSRIDFMLQKDDEKVLLEVKNVTLCCEPTVACFPDAVTTRGQKHLRDLMAAVSEGWRAGVFFLVQRGEAEVFTAADKIDAEYGRLLREAVECDVEVFAYRTIVSEDSNLVGAPLKVVL